MTERPKLDAIQENIAKRNAEEKRLREALTAAGFDGPHEIRSGDMFGHAMFGATPFRYAYCVGTDDWKGCGAVVPLGILMPHTTQEGTFIEKGIYLHSSFHDDLRG